MLAKLKKSWKRLWRAEPGQRFRHMHRARQRLDRPAWAKPLWIVIGLLILIAGIVALPLPGPGWLVIALGCAVIGGELGIVARGLDRLELRLRSVARWARKRWTDLASGGRAGMVALGAVLAGAGGYLAWTWILRDRLL